jgi:hypothetical protein
MHLGRKLRRRWRRLMAQRWHGRPATRWHSVSSTKAYETCARRYQFGYVERRPYDRPAPEPWRVGSAVHAALEAAYRFRYRDWPVLYGPKQPYRIYALTGR